jgi:hypothetical protein
MVRKYPRKGSVRRVIEEHLTAKDSMNFFKERGIIICARKKKDLAKIGGDYYLSQEDYSDFKNLMDAEQNYKKSGRITFSNNLKQNLEEALIGLNNKVIDQEDKTKITVMKDSEENMKVLISYDEYKPSLIDLLDRTSRQIEVTINSHNDNCSLDFNMQSSHDYKKVREVLNYISKNEEEVEFNFQEISLSNFPIVQRIELFEVFFRNIQEPWELVEINKLKVKRDSKETKVSEDQLDGINSALLDGYNLRANKFVKETLEKGFYFSMASMRLDKKNTKEFIDLVIDFKARPEMCEVKISNSGVYVPPENGEDLKEVKSVMHSSDQDKLLMEYKNILSEIYTTLQNTPITPDVEVASAAEDSPEYKTKD